LVIVFVGDFKLILNSILISTRRFGFLFFHFFSHL
jgi:hypothetical protein